MIALHQIEAENDNCTKGISMLLQHLARREQAVPTQVHESVGPRGHFFQISSIRRKIQVLVQLYTLGIPANKRTMRTNNEERGGSS